jgi:hypothetical protein
MIPSLSQIYLMLLLISLSTKLALATTLIWRGYCFIIIGIYLLYFYATEPLYKSYNNHSSDKHWEIFWETAAAD